MTCLLNNILSDNRNLKKCYYSILNQSINSSINRPIDRLINQSVITLNTEILITSLTASLTVLQVPRESFVHFALSRTPLPPPTPPLHTHTEKILATTLQTNSALIAQNVTCCYNCLIYFFLFYFRKQS